MKKVLIVLLILFGLAAISVAVFLWTFKWDRLQAVVVSQLEEKIHRKIHVGRLAFSFRDGMGLSLKDLAIEDDPQFSAQPCIQLGELDAKIRILPLLKKQVEVDRLILRSLQLRLVRNAQGVLNLSTLGTPVGPAISPESTQAFDGGNPLAAPPPLPIQFIISQILVENGSIVWIDQSSAPPLELSLTRVHLTADHVGLASPIEMVGEGCFFSVGQPNLFFQATVPMAGLSVDLEKVKATVRLEPALIDWTQLKQDLPSLAFLPLEGQAVRSGEIRFLLSQITPQGLTGEVTVQDGAIQIQGRNRLVEKIQAQIHLVPQALEMRQASLRFGTGEVGVDVRVRTTLNEPQFQGEIRVQNLSLEDLLPDGYDHEQPYFTGFLNGTVRFRTFRQVQRVGGVRPARPAGGEPSLLALSAQGEAQVQQGVLRNSNLANLILGRVSAIPGLREALLGGVSPRYGELLRRKDTVFERLDTHMAFSQGMVTISDLTAMTPDYAIQAQGMFNFERYVQMQGTLKASPELSGEIVHKVKEAGYLCDEQGLFAIPFTWGPDLKSVPAPDVVRVAQMILVHKGKEEADRALRKVFGREDSDEGRGGSRTAPPSGTAAAIEDLVNQLLQ